MKIQPIGSARWSWAGHTRRSDPKKEWRAQGRRKPHFKVHRIQFVITIATVRPM